MAEQQSTPVLPSTADLMPYVPVSWMAVSAAVVSGGFLLLLVSLGLWDFFVEKKPLLLYQLLVFPIAGVVLSFAARRMIRNSEGTRTGEPLAGAAWWVSVVTGLSFGAYLLAIDFAIRRDAENEGKTWVNTILLAQSGDLDSQPLNTAFIDTLEPDRRRGLSAANPGQLESEFRDPFLGFRQCDIVRLAIRNPGECRLDNGTVKDWAERPYGVDCLLTGVVKCKEGTFPIQVPVKGIEYGAASQTPGRKWMVQLPPGGVFVSDAIARTPYGWLVEAIEQSGMMFGKDFFSVIGNGSQNYAPIYHRMMGPIDRVPLTDILLKTTLGRVALGGQAMAAAPFYSKECAEYFRSGFFRLPGGGEPTPAQREDFNRAWDMSGLVPPGGRLKNNPDKAPHLIIGETGVEMKLPCELPLAGAELSAARCRLVLGLEDPNVIAELKELRAKANPDDATQASPASFRNRNFNRWRVLRVETDMRQIVVQNRPGLPNGSRDAPK